MQAKKPDYPTDSSIHFYKRKGILYFSHGPTGFADGKKTKDTLPAYYILEQDQEYYYCTFWGIGSKAITTQPADVMVSKELILNDR